MDRVIWEREPGAGGKAPDSLVAPASICRWKHRQEPEGRPQGGQRGQGRAGLGECLEPGGRRVQEGADGHG